MEILLDGVNVGAVKGPETLARLATEATNRRSVRLTLKDYYRLETETTTNDVVLFLKTIISRGTNLERFALRTDGGVDCSEFLRAIAAAHRYRTAPIQKLILHELGMLSPQVLADLLASGVVSVTLKKFSLAGPQQLGSQQALECLQDLELNDFQGATPGFFESILQLLAHHAPVLKRLCVIPGGRRPDISEVTRSHTKVNVTDGVVNLLRHNTRHLTELTLQYTLCVDLAPVCKVLLHNTTLTTLKLAPLDHHEETNYECLLNILKTKNTTLTTYALYPRGEMCQGMPIRKEIDLYTELNSYGRAEARDFETCLSKFVDIVSAVPRDIGSLSTSTFQYCLLKENPAVWVYPSLQDD